MYAVIMIEFLNAILAAHGDNPKKISYPPRISIHFHSIDHCKTDVFGLLSIQMSAVVGKAEYSHLAPRFPIPQYPRKGALRATTTIS